ncbi:type II toxin-antitoxin system RelE/ParE family toxin [Endozoicomonas sp. 4G]|uniref:type II toxin-antitoxin system RelE/ParE family toxin n=1 Tax=Endozoicomonas sp. 4G TaxID=2872754 RepID=UPI00211103FD|nr:type II toxin-antitoxin system RelE/ParE family toxin [Endozoicomonas sp. 4G]
MTSEGHRLISITKCLAQLNMNYSFWFEHLEGKLKIWCSIRVNKQYRLIFQWEAGEAHGLHLDPHTYR